MANDINSYVASYVQRRAEEGKPVDMEQLHTQLSSMASIFDWDDPNKKLLTPEIGKEYDLDAFSDMLDNGDFADLSDEDVELLFAIFDKDGEGSISFEEMSVLTDNDGNVTDYMLYQSLKHTLTDSGVKKELPDDFTSLSSSLLDDEAGLAALRNVYGDKADAIIEQLEGLKTKKDTVEIERQELSQQQLDDISQQIVDGTAKLSDYEQFLTPESYKALEAARDAKLEEKGATPSDQGSVTPSDQGSVTPSDQGSVTPSDQGSVTPSDQGSVTPSDQGTPDPADPKIAELKKGIENSVLSDPNDDLKSPEDIIQMWIDTGKYAADDPIIAELRASYVTYSDADEAKIATYTDPNGAFGMTREEAIAYLNNEGKLGAPVTSSSTPLEDPNAHKTLTDKAIKHHASEMLEALKGAGSDMNKVMGVLNDPNLTPEDIVDIVTEFKKQSGGISLVEYLDDQWANSDAVQELLADKLYAAAEKGDPDAAKAIADMMKGAMTGAGTADKFLEKMFNNLNGKSDIMQAVVQSYSGDLEADIKSDHKNWYGWGVNSTGQSYLDIIDKTLNDYYGRN